ncbi:hypothetical protein [Escherichia coli]|uniref:hypothetical protein n=2 Tax=Escherichia coli TaxID=562 RepID=UPI0002D49F7E|nr:hypothetical protein [Escherichia coli]ESE17236.1 hypothetical protein HMPREF1623_04539 [Escherichia coli 910096-2]
MRCAYQAYKVNCNLFNLQIFVGRIRRYAASGNMKRNLSATCFPANGGVFFCPQFTGNPQITPHFTH